MALIVSNNNFNKNNEDVLCCMITSNPEVRNCINISQRDVEKGNLFFDNKIKPYRLFTVNKHLILRKISLLKKEKALDVEDEIKKLINI